jgi:hypothetical protein
MKEAIEVGVGVGRSQCTGSTQYAPLFSIAPATSIRLLVDLQTEERQEQSTPRSSEPGQDIQSEHLQR